MAGATIMPTGGCIPASGPGPSIPRPTPSTTTASGDFSSAVGDRAQATARDATAIGPQSIASAQASAGCSEPRGTPMIVPPTRPMPYRSSCPSGTGYGAVPKFRAGIHCGPVVAGEIGDHRKQIVFVGDVVNTASRMETEAKSRKLNFVISGTLLSRIALPAGIAARSLGIVHPKGKEMPVELFEVSRC